MRSLREAEVGGKRVIVRVDFNVSFGPRDIEKGRVVDPTRISSHLETIQFLENQSPSQIVLISHQEEDSRIESLSPVAQYLWDLWEQKEGPKKQLPQGLGYWQLKDKIILLENIRFQKGEKENDPKLVERLAQLGEFFVLDALSVAHRDHASVTGLARHFLPNSFAGFLLERERNELSRLLSEPSRPFIVIIGGKKIGDKKPVIDHLAERADQILIGGMVANEILISKPKTKNLKLILPIDGLLENGKKVTIKEISPDRYSLIRDIGPETIRIFLKLISKAKTILWAGPLGKFEDKSFSRGTREISQAIAKSKAYSLSAGGDTIKALNLFRIFDKINFVSMGGGATLKFLAGEKLIALEVLDSS